MLCSCDEEMTLTDAIADCPRPGENYVQNYSLVTGCSGNAAFALHTDCKQIFPARLKFRARRTWWLALRSSTSCIAPNSFQQSVKN